MTQKMIVPITGEEAEKLTKQLLEYHDELRNKIWKHIVETYGEDSDAPSYNMETTPVPSHHYFYYDKGKYSLDNKIDEILNELNQKYFPQNP